MTGMPTRGPLVTGLDKRRSEDLAGRADICWASDRPAIVPLDLMPWWSPEFLSTAPYSEIAEDVYYVDWRLPVTRTLAHASEWVSAAIRDRRPVRWVSECLADELDDAEAAVAEIARSLRLRALPTTLLPEEDVIEEYYVLRVRSEHVEGNGFLPAATWNQLVERGSWRRRNPHGCSLLEGPSQADIDALWSVYAPAMDELNLANPIRATLDRSTFDALVSSPANAVLVARSHGTPVALTIVGVDTHLFDWLDASWLRSLRPQGEVTVWPTIATDPRHRRAGRIMELLQLAGDLIFQNGGDLVVVFSCDNATRNYTPAIVQAAQDAYRPRLSGEVVRAAQYIFRGFLLLPE